MTALRLGLALLPRHPDDWRNLALRAEDLDLDVLWVGDTLGDWLDRDAPFLDAWPLLGALSQVTERIQLGMLVTNLSWRSPVEVARWAMTVDQLSHGRFELGLGCGAVDDQVMAGPGVAAMAPAERVARLEEGVTVLDRLLRGDTSGFSGRFSGYDAAAMAPGCLQQPRPPIVVAGNGERVMRVAARHADGWNLLVDAATFDDFVEPARQRVRLFDEMCAEAGRDPGAVSRSLTLYFEAGDVWADPATLPRVVDTFRPLGFDEFVVYGPTPEQVSTFVHFGAKVLPSLRG